MQNLVFEMSIEVYTYIFWFSTPLRLCSPMTVACQVCVFWGRKILKNQVCYCVSFTCHGKFHVFLKACSTILKLHLYFWFKAVLSVI